MPKPIHTHLSRRESQIMDVIYQLGEATVGEVVKRLPDPPGYNSVRVTLGILEEKGYLTHRREAQRYVYLPTIPRERARRSAVEHLVETFFEGSTPKTVATLLDVSASRLGEAELEELSQMIREARKRRRR